MPPAFAFQRHGESITAHGVRGGCCLQYYVERRSPNLPPLSALATLQMPILLPWPGAEIRCTRCQRLQQLAATLPAARLHIADTPEQLQTWGELAPAAFLDD